MRLEEPVARIDDFMTVGVALPEFSARGDLDFIQQVELAAGEPVMGSIDGSDEKRSGSCKSILVGAERVWASGAGLLPAVQPNLVDQRFRLEIAKGGLSCIKRLIAAGELI